MQPTRGLNFSRLWILRRITCVSEGIDPDFMEILEIIYGFWIEIFKSPLELTRS